MFCGKCWQPRAVALRRTRWSSSFIAFPRKSLRHQLQFGSRPRSSSKYLISTSPSQLGPRRAFSEFRITDKQSGNTMAPALIQEVEDDSPRSPDVIQLTAIEETLRRLLLDVANYADTVSATTKLESQVDLPPDLAQQPLVLRFTGGWVRDKLLGVESHDIDVSINKMTGFQFGLCMKEYLEIPGNPEKYGLQGIATNDKQDQKAGTNGKSKVVGGLHKIEANPEKSKHLETVTTKVLGLDIDLVNLRKETYSDDSRNPKIEFGTPEEDAMRRDATVNAMFYNINTGLVEDFTKRGYEDLDEKILRTPLEPYQTFKDDPLRVMRLIRFASRLGYAIDPAALDAMQNPEIQEALKRKISRERVGTELEKALRGPDPHEALRLIFELDLYETIFCDPTAAAQSQYKPETGPWRTVIDFLRDMSQSDSVLAELLLDEPEDLFRAWILATMTPYRNAPRPGSTEPTKKSPPPIAATVAREGIKSTNSITNLVLAAVKNQEEISSFVDRVFERIRKPEKVFSGEDAAARDVLGMAIRRWGSDWRGQVVYAMLVEIADGDQSVEGIEKKYNIFSQHLQTLKILDAPSFKPFMDGKSLAKALGMAPGPWMKDALDVVMAYQLRHSDSLNLDDAVEEVRLARARTQKGGELTASLIRHFLQLTIRPLFAKSKLDSITESGHKNHAKALPKRLVTEAEDESVTRPWKAPQGKPALDQLRWCVDALNEDLVTQFWPLLVPPILTLVDDWEIKYKRLGAELLRGLLEVTRPEMLDRSGLGQVFADALMPCLTHIPTITPQEDSISLLNAVYPALLVLSRKRFRQASSTAKANPTQSIAHERIKFLDSIIRKGILYSYTQCSLMPRMISTFFTHLIALLNELGIESVKHLKYVLPAISESLSHPLATTDGQEPQIIIEMLLSATKALQSVILNGWPRMVHHRGEVLKGLVFCWIKVGTRSDQDAAELKSELHTTMAMLRAVVGNAVDLDDECKLLVNADARVKGLLEVDASSAESYPDVGR